MTILGLSKLNLVPSEEKYLQQCLGEGKTWFVTRKRSQGRCIQASGSTKEKVLNCYLNYRQHGAAVSLVNIVDGKVEHIKI